MSNPFLSNEYKDVETANLLAKAYVKDIGDTIAMTDGKHIFINTEDNLFKLLPLYNTDILKWLLWHEKMHIELNHHTRYFKYIKEATSKLTKEEVNIIMDILVHDWMTSKFPDIAKLMVLNNAEFRDSNSLNYTFATYTLEEMLDEYTIYKQQLPESEEEVTHHEEFITQEQGTDIIKEIQRLSNLKIKLGILTETINSLVTTTRKRTYTTPSTIHTNGGILLKGSKPGKTSLCLCFDASGSMSRQMELFKQLITKSIPQALPTPTVWFAGTTPVVYKKYNGYYKATFKEFMEIKADWGYDDDGDMTIDMCYKAEQQGYNPIGITDGGGKISWSKDELKKLKRTIFIGQNQLWLDNIKRINPNIQTIYIQI